MYDTLNSPKKYCEPKMISFSIVVRRQYVDNLLASICRSCNVKVLRKKRGWPRVLASRMIIGPCHALDVAA